MKFVTLAALFELEGDYETYKGAKRHDQILMILRFANRLARRIDDDRRAWVSISELLDPRIKL